MQQSLRVTYKPKTPLGEYIKMWCIHRGISQKEFAIGVGYTYAHQVFKLKRVSLDTYFNMIDYMGKNSTLPKSFYAIRLKDIITGEYKWTK